MWKDWLKKIWKVLAGIAMGVGAYAWYRAMYDRSVGVSAERLRNNRERADGIRDDNKQATDGINSAKEGVVTARDILERSGQLAHDSGERVDSLERDTERAMDILREIRERNGRATQDPKDKVNP